MKTITKKRMKASLIDSLAGELVAAGVRPVIGKKVKNKFVLEVMTPILITWGLEYIQLRRSGQTIGYKKMGLMLESEDGSELTSSQIIKRIMYRDTKSTFDYLKNRETFESEEGAKLPHDAFVNTLVKEQ